jgi:hypothetical protein
MRKQVYAAALLWVDPFLPELGAWGRYVRTMRIPPSDSRPEARKLVSFQAAMRALSLNPPTLNPPTPFKPG